MVTDYRNGWIVFGCILPLLRHEPTQMAATNTLVGSLLLLSLEKIGVFQIGKALKVRNTWAHYL